MGLNAASTGGELCELERYELEFFKMPVAVSLVSMHIENTELTLGALGVRRGRVQRGVCGHDCVGDTCGGWVF
jgi:hypothetical protein